jgi:hypothetical protein
MIVALAISRHTMVIYAWQTKLWRGRIGAILSRIRLKSKMGF